MLIIVIMLVVGLLLGLYRPSALAVMLFIVPPIMLVSGIVASFCVQPEVSIKAAGDVIEDVTHYASLTAQIIKYPVIVLVTTLAFVSIILQVRSPDRNRARIIIVAANLLAIVAVSYIILSVTSAPTGETALTSLIITLVLVSTEFMAFQLFVLVRDAISDLGLKISSRIFQVHSN